MVESIYQVSNWPLNLRSGGAELDNARVCGDNFVKLVFSLFLCFGGVCTSVNEQQQEFYEALTSDKGRLLLLDSSFQRKSSLYTGLLRLTSHIRGDFPSCFSV